MLLRFVRLCVVVCSGLATVTACGSDEADDASSAGSGGSGTGGEPAGGSGGAPSTSTAGGSGGGPAVACEPGTRPGDPAGAVGETTPEGIRFNVRTPSTYDATVAWPLLVVYAPAGGDEDLTESFTGLTPDATARNFVVAYADHISPVAMADIVDAAGVPIMVSGKWCIDPLRVYLTGHSDGGSMATLVALFEELEVAAIAPSAAGANGDFLNGQPCPGKPLPVMVLHSESDGLFPGFGAEAAAYWSSCAGCSPAGPPLADGCVAHTGCTGGVEVQYCEGTGQHAQWPDLNASMLDFFDRFSLPATR